MLHMHRRGTLVLHLLWGRHTKVRKHSGGTKDLPRNQLSYPGQSREKSPGFVSLRPGFDLLFLHDRINLIVSSVRTVPV